MDVRPLLCRHHGLGLEILFYYSHRFLNRGHIMFDCGGMAFREGGFQGSVAITDEPTQAYFEDHCVRTGARQAAVESEGLALRRFAMQRTVTASGGGVNIGIFDISSHTSIKFRGS